MKRWIVSGLVVLGCAAPKSEPKDLPGCATPPDDVEALLRELSRSERELEARLGDSDDEELGAGSAGMPPPAEEPAEPPEAAPTAEAEAGGEQAPKTAEPRAQTPCETACRAFASMRRSAERICELTGESDGRCSGARERVARAGQRIERAGCACDAPAP